MDYQIVGRSAAFIALLTTEVLCSQRLEDDHLMDAVDHTDAPLEDALHDLESIAMAEVVPVGTILDALQDRSLGFLLTVAGLLNCIPIIGAIPGLNDLTAVIVIVTVFHFFVGGTSRFWAPKRLRQIEIKGETIRAGLARMEPMARWIDHRLKRRLAILVEPVPAQAAIAITAFLLALSIFVLSFIPWAVLIPAIAVMAFGLALMSRDGLLALTGYIFVGGTGYAIFRFFF